MKFLFSFQFIAALFLILWGVSLLLNIIFKIHLPLGRIFFGSLLILAGIGLIFFTPAFYKKSVSTTSYNKDFEETNFVFGKAMIDFSKISAIDSSGGTKKINVVFSQADIIIDDNEYNIDIDAAFASVNTPEFSLSFGNRSLILKSIKNDKIVYNIKISAVFSNVNIRVASKI